MTDELLNAVTQKTGLTADQAKAAIDSVIDFLKERLPAAAANALDNIVAGGQGQTSSGLTDQAAGALGNMLGRKS